VSWNSSSHVDRSVLRFDLRAREGRGHEGGVLGGETEFDVGRSLASGDPCARKRRISMTWSVLGFLLRGQAGRMRPLEIVPLFMGRVEIKQFYT